MSLPPENAAEIEITRAADSLSRSRFKLDLLTSYALSAARVGSNVAIFAILYRYTNERYAATYAVIRSMLMLLTYVFGGFNPVLQRLLHSKSATHVKATAALAQAARDHDTADRKTPRSPSSEAAINYAQANAVAFALAVAVLFALYVYSDSAYRIHEFAITRVWQVSPFIWMFGIGMLIRLVTEPASAVLQARNKLWLDNLIVICGEIAFVLLTMRFVRWNVAAWVDSWLISSANSNGRIFLGVADAFVSSSVIVFLARVAVARILVGFDLRPLLIFRPKTLIAIASGVALISLGQFADFLYAPANILLINTFIHPSAVARYAPALQIDAGLLLLIGAVSSVMLPRAMAVWARGDRELLRSAYIRSTLACLFVLTCAAIFVGVFIEPILTLWLGTVPQDAAMITRLVLIHTVIGGTAGVGRSVLLGMGRFKAYTISALLGGVANVGLALLFVLVFDLGLRGIVLATVISVTVRCAIWMPWYVLRSLRSTPHESRSSLRSDAGV